MSVTALVTGTLIADPERRVGAGNRPFTLARLAPSTGSAGEQFLVLAYGHLGEQLATLCEGDSVTVTGPARVRTWQARVGASHSGLSVTAAQVLTIFHLRRKRAAMAGEAAAPAPVALPPRSAQATAVTVPGPLRISATYGQTTPSSRKGST